MMLGARGRRVPFPSAVLSLACCGVLLAAAALAGESGGARTAPQARLAATDYDFGEVRQGQTVSHDFLVRNLGKGVLRTERAELSHPNMNLKAPTIEPRSEGHISLELTTTESAGKIEAQAIVFFNDPLLPKAVLTLRGKVRPPIEF